MSTSDNNTKAAEHAKKFDADQPTLGSDLHNQSSTATEQPTNTAPPSSGGILETAKSYVAAGEERTEQLINQVGTAAKQYLPESVASYLPGEAPKKPTYIHKKPTGGVGSLPGTPNEEGVAKLPEERRQEALERSLEALASKKDAVKSQVEPTLPSQEGKSEDIGKTEGVGALPGSRDERGVAILPEERHQGLTVNETTGDLQRSSAIRHHEHIPTAPSTHPQRTDPSPAQPPSYVSAASSAIPITTHANATQVDKRDVPIIDVNREQVHHYQEQRGQSTLAEARDRLHSANNNNTQRGASATTTTTASQGAQRAPHHQSHQKHHVSGTTGAQGSQPAAATAAGSGAPIRTSQGVPSSEGIIPGVPSSTFSATDRGRVSHEHATSDKQHGREHATSHRHEQGTSDRHGHEQVTSDKHGHEHGQGFGDEHAPFKKPTLMEQEQDQRQGFGDEHASLKKPTFMEKVKGEAKILEGKLSKNKDQVEAGERMKGK